MVPALNTRKSPKETSHSSAAETATAPPAGAAGREERWQMIATAAYYRAQQRGFAPGGELDDWLAAEAEIAQALGDKSH